jgi:hypothetical protein
MTEPEIGDVRIVQSCGRWGFEKFDDLCEYADLLDDEAYERLLDSAPDWICIRQFDTQAEAAAYMRYWLDL